MVRKLRTPFSRPGQRLATSLLIKVVPDPFIEWDPPSPTVFGEAHSRLLEVLPTEEGWVRIVTFCDKDAGHRPVEGVGVDDAPHGDGRSSRCLWSTRCNPRSADFSSHCRAVDVSCSEGSAIGRRKVASDSG